MQFKPYVSQDQMDAEAYWRGKPIKKWAVTITAGPMKRPRYQRIVYVSAVSDARAEACARREVWPKPPRGATYQVRLAGPVELGCIPSRDQSGIDLAEAIRKATDIWTLKRLVGPSAQEVVEAAEREEEIQRLEPMCEWDALFPSFEARRSRERQIDLIAEQESYRAIYFDVTDDGAAN